MNSEMLVYLTQTVTALIALTTLINLSLGILSNYRITKVERQTNSLMDQLVLEVRAASIAKTILTERKRAAKRQHNIKL